LEESLTAFIFMIGEACERLRPLFKKGAEQLISSLCCKKPYEVVCFKTFFFIKNFYFFYKNICYKKYFF